MKILKLAMPPINTVSPPGKIEVLLLAGDGGFPSPAPAKSEER